LRKGEQKKQEKLARIVAAAKEAFTFQRFEDVRIDRIAQQASVAKGTVFLYAATKEELLFLAFRKELENQVFGSLEPLKGEAVRDWLLRHLLASCEYFQRSPVLGKTMVRALGWTGPGALHVHDFAVRYEAVLAAHFGAYRAAGQIHERFDPGFLARFVIDLFFGVQRRWLIDFITYEELRTQLSDNVDTLLLATQIDL